MLWYTAKYDPCLWQPTQKQSPCKVVATCLARDVITQTGLADEPKSKKKGKQETSFTKLAIQELKSIVQNVRSITWPRYQHMFIMKGLYDLSLGIIFVNIGLILLEEFHVEGRNLGYVFFMASVFAIGSNILKLRLINTLANIPDRLKIIQGSIVLLVSFITMSLSSSTYLFIAFIGIMCIARTFMDGFWTEMILTQTLDTDKGKVVAAFENLAPLMSFVAPVLSGLVAEVYGARVLVFSAAIPISLVSLIAYGQKNKTE